MKNQKGISIIALILTVVILLILATALIRGSGDSADVQKYNNMCADIVLLEDKISIYYNKYQVIPVQESEISQELIPNIIKTKENNQGSYYYIDLTQISNVTLNYGDGTLNSKDKYIINTMSHKVYYLNGIVLDEKTYYARDTRI